MTQSKQFQIEGSEPLFQTRSVTIPCELQSTPKGVIVERRFEIAVLERGYAIAANTGGGKDFDYIVRPPFGRPVVVQVKTGRWRAEKRYYLIQNHRCGEIYTPNAYDVLAAYLPDRGQWIFYTRNELGNRKTTNYMPQECRMHQRRDGIMDARNPDNWELLDEVAQSFT